MTRHVGIDLDDVCLDFFPNVLDCFEREFGERPEYDGDPWGEQAKALTQHPKLLAAGYSSWWGWLRDRDWLWGIAPAVPGAVGGVKTLRAQGHYVEAVTSKPTWAEPQVWRWLGKWRIPFERVTIVPPEQRKVDRTSADILVDDKLENVTQFAEAGRYGIWFTRHEQHHRLPIRVVRARNWEEVVRLVGIIEEENR